MSYPKESIIENLLQRWQSDSSIAENIVYNHLQVARIPRWREFPNDVAPELVQALRSHGIQRLFDHQADSWDALQSGSNLVVVTGTASGKSLCYNLPVVNELLRSFSATALYLFPTKALGYDQQRELRSILRSVSEYTCKKDFAPAPFTQAEIYDGDTPASNRSRVRNEARIVITNPDMLHSGILPHHTLWSRFFKGLRYVVIDEMHIYRGVFGSHTANLIRRLKRIAAFYGSFPQFILTSATIANPKDLAESLIEEPVVMIDQDGSSHGEQHFLLYNPPVVDRRTGLRKSALSESLRLSDDLLTQDIQILLFTRTRRSVEIALRQFRHKVSTDNDIRGYRSGYLPSERRKIEQDMRSGQARAVIATNALELGVDIGGMDAVILIGYPGTISATRQQIGRAGRRDRFSLGILVASANPLDQYLIKHPEFLLGRSPEMALVNPDNLLILLQHIRCASFELPFSDEERFGNVSIDLLKELLQLLEESGVLHYSTGRYYWTADQYPAQDISLRSGSGRRIALLETSETGQQRMIGEVDFESAAWMVHPQAIYMHEGRSYEVTDLDLDKARAHLQPVDLDYFTEAKRDTSIQCIQELRSAQMPGCSIHYGEVLVTTRVTGYRRIRWFTNENVGSYPLDMPPSELRTTAFWAVIDEETISQLRKAGLWNNDDNNYGPAWNRIRLAVRQRDHFTCQLCGQLERDQALHVHHKIPFRQFTDPVEANRLDNLITLCPTCHQMVETNVRIRSGLSGLCYVLHNLAPIIVMCDINDLGSISDVQSPLAMGQPALVLYDQVPAGIGLTEAIYQQYPDLLSRANELVQSCDCEDGCPACVGPAGENGVGGKEETLALLSILSKQPDR